MQGFLLDQGDRDPAVAALKACLARALTPAPALTPGPDFDAATAAAVVRYQAARGAKPDGVVGPVTWALLGASLGHDPAALPPLDDVPAWVRNTLRNDPAQTSVRGLDVPAALALYERSFGALSARQREGLGFLLGAVAADADVTDVRWAAYMLATVKHECADRWQPIEEFGKGKGLKYGRPVSFTGSDGRAYAHTYYGRGYVQLTWDGNYHEVGRQLGMGDELRRRPELALDPAVAYRIMSHGMRLGTFTSKTLARYIAGATCDYKNARRIINGLDRWELVQGYAERLQAILLACVPAAGAGGARGLGRGVATRAPAKRAAKRTAAKRVATKRAGARPAPRKRAARPRRTRST